VRGYSYLGVISKAVGGAYSLGKAFDNYRYWRDYERNTGVKPKYPFRSGRYDYLGYSAGSMRQFSELPNYPKVKVRPRYSSRRRRNLYVYHKR